MTERSAAVAAAFAIILAGLALAAPAAAATGFDEGLSLMAARTPADTRIEVQAARPAPAPVAPLVEVEQAECDPVLCMIDDVIAAAKAVVPAPIKLDRRHEWDGVGDPGTVTFPAARHECATVASRSGLSDDFCADLIWSASLVELVVAIYTKTDAPAARRPHDLAGRVICEPRGPLTGAARSLGLTPFNSRIVTMADLNACFDMQKLGVVDAVIAPRMTGDAMIVAKGLDDMVAAAPAIDQVFSFHAVASRRSPEAVAELLILNEALHRLRVTGAWFELVAPHMAGAAGAEPSETLAGVD